MAASKKIKGEVLNISEYGKENEFETLDGISRSLITTDTVISDSERPLVLAGVMGGSDSMVDDSTTSIFIEVWCRKYSS